MTVCACICASVAMRTRDSSSSINVRVHPIRLQPSVTRVNPRRSEVDGNICGEKNIDHQVHPENSPVIEARHFALSATG